MDEDDMDHELDWLSLERAAEEYWSRGDAVVAPVIDAEVA